MKTCLLGSDTPRILCFSGLCTVREMTAPWSSMKIQASRSNSYSVEMFVLPFQDQATASSVVMISSTAVLSFGNLGRVWLYMGWCMEFMSMQEITCTSQVLSLAYHFIVQAYFYSLLSVFNCWLAVCLNVTSWVCDSRTKQGRITDQRGACSGLHTMSVGSFPPVWVAYWIDSQCMHIKTLLCNDYTCNTISHFNLLKLDLQLPSYMYVYTVTVLCAL